MEFNIWDYVYRFDDQEETSFKKWFNNSETKSFETLVNMHQFGYTVPREKKYMVKIKGFNESKSTLKYGDLSDIWYFGDPMGYSCVRIYHTHEQIEECGLAGVFDNPMFEVKEVE